MKKFILILLFLAFGSVTFAQDFDKNVASAKSSYASGNLQDSRFAMEQALRDLDMAIGKEILRVLPVKLGSLAAVEKEDNDQNKLKKDDVKMAHHPSGNRIIQLPDLDHEITKQHRCILLSNNSSF